MDFPTLFHEYQPPASTASTAAIFPPQPSASSKQQQQQQPHYSSSALLYSSPATSAPPPPVNLHVAPTTAAAAAPLPQYHHPSVAHLHQQHYGSEASADPHHYHHHNQSIQSSSSCYHYYPVNPNPNPYAPHGGYASLAQDHYYLYQQHQHYALTVAGIGNSNGGGGLVSYYGVGVDRAGSEDAGALSLKEAIRHYGPDPGYGLGTRPSNGFVPDIPSIAEPAFVDRNRKKHAKMMKIKAVKKAAKHLTFCEVCKIECTSHEVLLTHKKGKKHKKQLQKLQESITPKVPKVSAVFPAATTFTSKKEASVSGGKRFAPSTGEELETKKKRIIEGGAALEGVRVCTICNVVVNSQQVFESHVTGQKHAAMLRKVQATQQVATVS